MVWKQTVSVRVRRALSATKAYLKRQTTGHIMMYTIT